MLKKSKLSILFLFFLTGYLIWWLSRPVIIIDVHKIRHWSHIIVKNFPITDVGKIAWWKKNQIFLKEKYDIPNPKDNGVFSVTIWDYGKGYEVYPYAERGNEMICFDDMPTETNCLEKHVLLEIRRERSSDREYYY